MKATSACLASVATILVVAVSAQTRDAEPLIEAIRQNDKAAVSKAIDAGANPNAKNANGVPVLMLATLYADATLVEALLKLGADPNQTDSTGVTALMWAIPDRQMARVLLDHGANVNAQSTNLGRTPLLIAAASPGSVDLLELLLSRGANLRAKDTAGYSAVAMAMRSADVEVLRWLTAKGLDVKGEVPAISAIAAYVRPRPSLVEFAVEQGVKPPKDILIRGSNWQRPDMIERWIAQGAEVNARGGPYNQTPLLTAASSELASAETLRVLLAHGANPNLPDGEGETPLDWAIYRSDAARIAILEKHGATRGEGPRRQPLPPPPTGRPVDPRVAVERGVALLLKSAPPMFEQRRCFTCHHNAVPAEAAALARKKGIPVPEDLAARNVADILAVFKQSAMPAMQAQPGIPGNVALTAGYGLMALSAERHPIDDVTAAMAHWVLASQMSDGSWIGNGVNRPPIEYSSIAHTAIALRGLTLYAPAGRRSQVDEAVARARQWLIKTQATVAEDRAMRLLGLVWTKAPASALAPAIDAIVRAQAPSGGWSQLDQLQPDAYATGLSLVALHEAGRAVSDDVYRRGVAFLLSTQYPDGSWLVRTRSFPTQLYFESGFPFGRHQWISAAGTAWAARAIALTLPDGL